MANIQQDSNSSLKKTCPTHDHSDDMNGYVITSLDHLRLHDGVAVYPASQGCQSIKQRCLWNGSAQAIVDNDRFLQYH